MTINIESLNKDKDNIAKMFDEIAINYDKINHIISLRSDIRWRKKLVKHLKAENPKIILDLAAGTGELAIELLSLKPETIYLTDISEKMLNIAQKKIEKIQTTTNCYYVVNAAETLNFEDNTFDIVTIGFGIRNFQNKELALKEIYRVLKNNGILAILEFGTPSNFIWKKLYSLYQSLILVPIAKMISKHNTAYHYLKESSNKFIYAYQFVNLCKQAGFKEVKMQKIKAGIVYLYLLQKSTDK